MNGRYLSANPHGPSPVFSVAITAADAVSMTDTSFDMPLAV
jgi:hypothetical protein